ncbi:MAG TPA: universal stress protein [Sphingomonadales bacterium]|nr:universal stress protein [Sphingomonadales bacterium]
MIYLAALDFSKVTPAVIRWLARNATAKDKIILLHAAEPNPVFVGYEAGPDVVRKQVADEYKREHREIQKLGASLRRKGLKTTAVLAQGPGAPTILKTAEKAKADLIVMGTRGHGKVRQILMGSVSAAVLKKSSIPVLLVPVVK